MGRALAAIGIILTLGYVFFAWWLVGDRIQTLRYMDLNEVGDFLAGAFGPIAILWLVLGFFQQGDELRQSTAALEEQSKQLKSTSDHQRNVAEISLKALELNREERIARDHQYRASLKPIFSIEAGKFIEKDDFCELDCRVINDGALVFNVFIICSRAEIEYACHRHGNIANGGVASFTCKWSKDVPGTSLIITIRYEEQDSTIGVKRFHCVVVGRIDNFEFVENF